MSMVPASQLRVYEPLTVFPEKQRERWTAALQSGVRGRWVYRDAAVATGMVGLLYPVDRDHASMRRINGEAVACPSSVRMGVLAGIVACHGDPDACGFIVPQDEVQRATQELERLRNEAPALRDHVAYSAWHVPFRWLAAFDDAERILTSGEPPRLRYETELSLAAGRLRRAHGILECAGMDDSINTPVAELADWLDEFDPESRLELDYGGLTPLISQESLESDRSAGEIWACLEAMELGDLDECQRRYAELAAWWDEVRSVERQN
ncbi:MAG: hypothetical protein ACRDJU_00270 [Actinomycetota bacterium]